MSNLSYTPPSDDLRSLSDELPTFGDANHWHYRIECSSGQPILIAGSGLHVCSVVSADGVDVGTVFGFPIDLTSKSFPIGPKLELPFNVIGREDVFVDELYTVLAGRFAWLAKLNGSDRLYLDAGGQIPAVYDRDSWMAGVSADAILSERAYAQRFDRDLFDALNISVKGWVAGEHTVHEGVRRLLPNHFLDLQTFEVERHWGANEPKVTEDVDGTLDDIITEMTAQLEALQNSGKTVLQAVTAGHDSRVILAVSESWTKDTEYFTVVHGQDKSIDAIVAPKLVEMVGGAHSAVRRVLATAGQKSAYMRRNGHVVADENVNSFPTMHQFSETHVFVGGTYGEIGAGLFWNQSDNQSIKLDGATLMQRMGLPPSSKIARNLDEWLDGLETLHLRERLTRAFLEARWASWSSAQFPADPSIVRFAPFATRNVFEAMLSLPLETRAANDLSYLLIRRINPELAAVPYNSLGPVRDKIMKIKRAIADPDIIRRKLRKLRRLG